MIDRRIAAAALGAALLAGPGSAQTPPSEASQPRPAEVSGAPLPSDAGPAAPAGPRARPRLSERERTLLERPDRQRFDEGPTLSVFGRPLIFGGQYTMRARYAAEQLADKGNEIDYLRLNNELRLDVFYPWTEHASAYLQGRFVNRNLLWATNADADDEWDAELGEGWLFLGRLLATPVSLQVGRQRMFDEREWWWDEEFDAVRLHFDLERLHAEASVADSLAPISTDLDRQDPKKQDILYAFGRAIFEWAPNQQIGLYGLHQDDHSDPHFVGQVVDGEEEEDESDGDLTWLGVSALGRQPLGRYGRLAYWLDGAYVWGDETFYKFSGPSNIRKLSSPKRIHDYSVGGWGFDVGATWELPLPGRPSLTLGYARGSGRSGMTKEEDRGFRQTGLQDDNWKWRGSVNRYKYYGELLEPELSNLQIFTAAVGFHLLRKSSVTLAFHHFRQVEAAPYLRDVSISADPDGMHRSIGQELDLMIGIEEWKRVQLELIGGVFRAGAAFGPVPAEDRFDSQVGDLSYLAVLQFRVNY